MTAERMVELLEIEHQCMLRAAHGDCERKCQDCDLVQDDGELHEMYTDVIGILKNMTPKHVIDPGAICPKCKMPIFPEEHPHYCGYCGQAVKWGYEG